MKQLYSIDDVIESANSISVNFKQITNIDTTAIKNPAKASSLSSIRKNLNKYTLKAKNKFLEEYSNVKQK